jgi:hypothetical protein
MRAQATATVEVQVIALNNENTVEVFLWHDTLEAKKWVNMLHGTPIIAPKDLYQYTLPGVVEAYNNTIANSLVVKTVKLEVPIDGPNVEVQ